MGGHPVLSPFGLFPGTNVQVTSYTWYPGDRNSRSECDLVTDPTNSNNLIAASKRFYDYEHYRFTVATAYSGDGGSTWHKLADLVLLNGDEAVAGYTDPALAMDQNGTAYLVAEPDIWTTQPDPNDVLSIGMAVFGSTAKTHPGLTQPRRSRSYPGCSTASKMVLTSSGLRPIIIRPVSTVEASMSSGAPTSTLFCPQA